MFSTQDLEYRILGRNATSCYSEQSTHSTFLGVKTKVKKCCWVLGDRHSSVVSSVPNPAAPGSNPKHTIYAFFNLY